MNPFKCRHPAKKLSLYDGKEHVMPVDEDFELVTVKLACSCGERLELKVSRCIGGVGAFLERGSQPQKDSPAITPVTDQVNKEGISSGVHTPGNSNRGKGDDRG